MTTVLGVHGAFHEMWGPTQILNRWRPALADGVLIAGGRLPDDAVGVAFYGDLFRHEPADGQLDDDALRALARASGLADVAQQMLGPDAASVLAQVMGEDMLRRTVDQVGHYFGDDGVRASVRGGWRPRSDRTRGCSSPIRSARSSRTTACAHIRSGRSRRS